MLNNTKHSRSTRSKHALWIYDTWPRNAKQNDITIIGNLTRYLSISSHYNSYEINFKYVIQKSGSDAAWLAQLLFCEMCRKHRLRRVWWNTLQVKGTSTIFFCYLIAYESSLQSRRLTESMWSLHIFCYRRLMHIKLYVFIYIYANTIWNKLNILHMVLNLSYIYCVANLPSPVLQYSGWGW